MSGHRAHLKRRSKRMGAVKPLPASEEKASPLACRREAHPDPASGPAERERLLFHIGGLWVGLLDPRWGPGVWGALRTAILTALRSEGELRSCCIVCRQDWEADPGMYPDGVLTAEPIKGDVPGSVSLICAICWDGTWNERLRAAIAREFGIDQSNLRALQSGGRA
jgi:hypothetical protein